MKKFASVATASRRQWIASAVLAVVLSSAAGAQLFTGTATNGTTGKPAAGDEIILINLSNGMEVAAKTTADSSGKFSFKLTDSDGPHLIRAVHQGVTYHQMVPPGMNSADVQVYDVAQKIAEISLTADGMRIEADRGTLRVMRRFAVNNASSPPKTQMNDHNFEFYLPAGAKVADTMAVAPNGKPISARTTPQAEKNRFAIAFPLRPGTTQFQVEFTVPYSGTIKIDPKPLYPSQHVIVEFPATMQFAAADPSLFQPIEDPDHGDAVIQIAQRTQPGQPLGFTLTGTGTIAETPAQAASGSARGQGRDNRPGGGLGPPTDAPDPLRQYRWPILIGFSVVLAVGAWVVMKRQPTTVGAPSASIADPRLPSPVLTAPASGSAPVARSAMLLEALKEEMFQLELERRQDKITPAEYEQAKAALDQTLDRALKRQA